MYPTLSLFAESLIELQYLTCGVGVFVYAGLEFVEDIYILG